MAISVQSTDTTLLKLQEAQRTQQKQQVSAESSSSGSGVSVSSALPKTDRVEISQTAKDALAQSKRSIASANAAAEKQGAGTQKSAVSQAAASLASSMGITSDSDSATTSSSSSSSDSSNLSSYSEQQLNNLVSEGKITKSQAQAELARRASADQKAPQADTAQNAAVQSYLNVQNSVSSTPMVEQGALMNAVA